MRSAALVFAIASAFAQGGIEGVRSGLLYDPPSASIRFVEGVPGAAFLGRPILERVQAAWISPSGRVALARVEGASVELRNLGAEAVETVGLGVDVRKARWSPAGRYAVVWLADGQLGVWDAESGMWRMTAHTDGEGEIAGAAVTEEGTLLTAWFNGETTRLTSLREGERQELGHVRGKGAIACGAGIAALVGESEIALFNGEGEIWRISTGREDQPVGAEVIGGWIAAAFGGENPELVFWTLEGKESRLPLEVLPDRLEALAGADGLLLKLREQKGDEIWVAVRRGNHWLAFFVPAGE